MHAPPEIALIAFDVDGTLVEHPEHKVIWELLNHRFTGSPETSLARYRDFREGRIDYPRWVELDVSDWIAAGARREQILESVRELTPVRGAHEALQELVRRGYHLAVISGTLDIVIEEHFPEHPFQEVYTNRLHFDDSGRLGGWTATPYDQEGKAHALALLAERNGLPISRCAFVGDHVNDCAVARLAGYSIAWNPKCHEIEAAASCVVRGATLEAVVERFPAIEKE